ncbi:MAG: hypothetical protein R2851_07345 [Caldilineaceae bacterium]
MTVVYIFLCVVGIHWLQRATGLDAWSLHYGLAVANETTGDRQWQGQVEQLTMLDRAL